MDYSAILNNRQLEAVKCTEGPLLILAGAGSGKTRVITYRIAYLIGEMGVRPWNILAITFTNKAAGEMRERVDKIVGERAQAVHISTFHSLCVRILRKNIECLGYGSNFTIYDTSDQKALMKRVIKKLDMDQKLYRERGVLSRISDCKNRLVTAEQFSDEAAGDFRETKIAEAYKEYQAELKQNNALDFDDLIMLTVKLFKEQPKVLEQYQERFRYIMVDEYQDTNAAQFELVRLLASKYKNICVVGDDDQSIYRFRGADITNILSFETSYPGAVSVKLEQNYRSTESILQAANDVISNNTGRMEKHLWSDNGQGRPVQLWRSETAAKEAEAIALDIAGRVRRGARYGDHALLYRTNAQSRLLEEKLVMRSIPYKIVGGTGFYDRKEVKDLLSYLRILNNSSDDLAVQRVINTPRRGIGQASIGKVQMFADANGMSFYDACLEASVIPGLGKTSQKINGFVGQMTLFGEKSANLPLADAIEFIVEKTGYMSEFGSETADEQAARLENIEELKSKAADYTRECVQAGTEATLAGFLEDVALVADTDSLEDSDNCVLLMTLHSAKGLEFPVVYMTGMEDGLFPGMGAVVSGDEGDIEEERRLCYVGITRAQKELILTYAEQRMVNGRTQYHAASRFLDEISALAGQSEKPAAGGYGSGGYYPGEERQRARSREYGNGDLAGSRGSASYGPGYERTAARSGSAGTKAGGAKKSGLKDKSNTLYFGKEFKTEKAERLEYTVGDRVRHVKFGDGTVTAITEQKRDYEVTVEFDTMGTRRMYAGFAKLVKL